jgi:hypothetical protein
MNERIRELIEQATTEEHDGFRYFDKRKFAELIVKECVLISRTGTDGFSAGKRMEEHFGVEE